jgi:membrane protease subunit (stomatin/prohibitin family)
MEKLRAELVDVIEWVDDSRHTLVWRFPRYHNQIKYGAQLIVRPGQAAVFVHQGKVADVFGPGQHRLETRNLPILSTLAGWLYGFDSPFKAEVYFVSTRQLTDLKWGTPNPVLMRDPDFGPIRVRAFGTYTLRALDPRTLLSELVGTDSEFESEEISELLRAMVNQAFADVVAKSEIPVLDLAANYADLSEEVRRVVLERIDDEYGLEVPQLVIVNISVPAEVEEALDARSSMGVLGDLGAYQQYRLGHAMPVAAANPAGGLAGAGVGHGDGEPVGAGRAGRRSASASPARTRVAHRRERPVLRSVHAGAARPGGWCGAPADRHAGLDRGDGRLGDCRRAAPALRPLRQHPAPSAPRALASARRDARGR